MADAAADHDAAIASFLEVTGSGDPATAEHVLEAHGWALDAAVAFFLEHGAGGAAPAARPPPPAPRSDSPVIVSGGDSPPYVMVDEEEVQKRGGARAWHPPPHTNARARRQPGARPLSSLLLSLPTH